jgi:Trk K+ transport system NAD-binding subunit
MIIPNGQTTVCPGDRLVVASSVATLGDIQVLFCAGAAHD